MEQLLLVIALSTDAFAAGVTYGARRIRVGFPAVGIVAFFGGAALALSVLLSGSVTPFCPPGLGKAAAFFLLCGLGVYQLFQESIRRAAYRFRKSRGKRESHLLEVMLDETKADADGSRSLGLSEAAYLGAALSLDSVTAGIGCGLAGMDAFQVGLAAFLFHLAVVPLGILCGKRLIRRFRPDLSHFGGLILIGLAVVRLFS